MAVVSRSLSRARARKTGKPILCVILEKGNRASSKLEREFTRSKKLRALLDEFVRVKLDRAAHADLVTKFGLKHSPSTVFYTRLGTPMKTIVGPVSTGKYISQMKAALEKNRTLFRPRRPTKTPPPSRSRTTNRCLASPTQRRAPTPAPRAP